MVKNPKDQQLNEEKMKNENGFDHNDSAEYTTSNSYKKNSYAEQYMNNINMKEIKGAGFLVSGLLLFLYAWGVLPILNWAIMAAGVFFIVYGANQVKLWDKMVIGYEYIKSMFAKNKNH